MHTPDTASAPQQLPTLKEWTSLIGDVKHTYTYDGRSVVDFQPPDEGWIGRVIHNWKEHVKNTPPYPGNFSGRGIVTCAGGVKYLTCAWVCITMLRKLGCTLPVEMWYTDNEINQEMKDALAELKVECKDVKDYNRKYRGLKGFALKPFAILNSSFKEVLFLDADNNCVADPTYLFETDAYKMHGAIFWPDCRMIDKNNPIYTIVDYDDYNSYEQESGQLLIDKERCWTELNLCMYFNTKPQTFYKLLYGDKDTFRFAWIALRTPFHMISKPVGFCGFRDRDKGFCNTTLVQHDPDGNILFLHRNWFKWSQMLDDEVMWSVIKRFKPGATRRHVVKHFISRHDGALAFFDCEGDVEEVPFSELFGDYELQCLDILKKFRNNERYGRFLLHSYFCVTRDGYTAGFMDKVGENI
ncbi:MAG TPA: hypothetical protein VD996_14630 [Chitinophagaceae bacterium]|nr:hypothetical protein [Chitinophagaceae bacterium]